MSEFHCILPLFLTNVSAEECPRNMLAAPALCLKMGFVSFPKGLRAPEQVQFTQRATSASRFRAE